MNPQNLLAADRGVMQFDVRAVKFSTIAHRNEEEIGG